MTPIRIHDPADPRVAAYGEIRERDLAGRDGLFVAEGRVVIANLVSQASRYVMASAFVAEARLEGMRDLLAQAPQGTPIYVADQAVLNAVAGFDIHRGILAVGVRTPPPEPSTLMETAGADAVVVVACGIGNHDNLGGLFRNAAAFGAHAVLLDDTCCDPLYRKAIRVSVGASLRMPWAMGSGAALADALAAAGFDLLALSPAATRPLSTLRPGGRQALWLGSEGPGLPPAILARCRTVGVAMSGGFDSLNVAATSAIALHQLTR